MKKERAKLPARTENKKAICQSKVKSYGNDPFFVKKAKESKKVLEKARSS